MKILINSDVDTKEGRVITIGEQTFTFPLDMENDEIKKRVRDILEIKIKKDKEFDDLDREDIIRLTDTKIEVL